jgi:hypothetical protein
MDRHDDADDFYEQPPPKKSGASPTLIVGIVVGAGMLLIFLLMFCGATFFLGRVAGPDEHQHWQAEPARHENGAVNEGPAKPEAVKERESEMKAKHGPPAGSDK